MIVVLGQDTTLTTLHHQQLRQQVHSSLFFQGEPGVGKLETALWFAQGYFCDRRSDTTEGVPSIACGTCRSCLGIEFFRHPHTLFLTVGDRLPALRFWRQSLTTAADPPNPGTEQPHPIVYQIGREVAQLLSRHRQRLLDPVVRIKTTYREGVKLNSEELEELIHRVSHQYRSILHPTELVDIPPDITKETFLSDMRKLQNSLDRSVLTKDNLDRMLTWCKHNAGEKKLVIIENIELINHNVVGLFLKILEDPPPQVTFILITEDMDNLNQEVTLPLLSRCLHFPFSPLNGKIDEILRRKFHIETGFINHESNFQLFFHKQATFTTKPALEFLLQPIHQIMIKVQEKNFQEEEIVSELYTTLENYATYAIKGVGEKGGSHSVKINYRQALSILQFLNKNYQLVKKNNYNKDHFFVELSLLIKKILKVSPYQLKNSDI